MKLKDSETDVMDLPLSETGVKEEDLVLVKESSTEFNLTGIWTGKVISADNADATINFASDGVTLTVGEDSFVSKGISKEGNFFRVTWNTGEQSEESTETTGLISVSGKAWLDDGSVFIKISPRRNYSVIW